MAQTGTYSRVEKLTRAVVASEDGGIPLARFVSDYHRMTKTQFPWKEHGFISARDMLVSMESTVEFRFCDEENQFYLVPVAQNSGGNSYAHCNQDDSITFTSTPVRTEHGNCGRNSNNDFVSDVPLLVEDKLTTVAQGDSGVYELDRYGRFSLYVTQTKDKPVKNFWNKPNLKKMFSPFGDVVDVAVMSNNRSGFVRFWTVEEAKKAVESLNNMPISSDGIKLIVQPPKSKHQKPGAPAANKEAPKSYKKEAARPTTKHPVKQLNKMRTAQVKSSPNDGSDDDNDDVWDDGLLPRHVHGNSHRSDGGVANGMTALDIGETDSGSLREMFVSEVESPGLLWLKDASLSGRDLQLLSLSIEMQQDQVKKLQSWMLPKEGTVYCINTQELEKNKGEVKWKRVVVNRVLQSSEQVEVRYVDIGEVASLQMSSLYSVPSSCQLQEVPPAVIPCYLWGVASTHDKREWWPLDNQLLWSLIRNKKVFAKLRSSIVEISDHNQHCVPVELFFDADGTQDIREQLIADGHFVTQTDNSVVSKESDSSEISSPVVSTPVESGTMWKPARKATTDPLPQSHSHNHNDTETSSSSMWKPKKLPTNLSFSDW